MGGQVLYKSKAACRIGGAFRRAGEVFPLPEFETTPHFLTRVDGPAGAVETDAAEEKPRGAAPGRRPRGAAAPGPMPADLPGVVRD